jgi:CheY-like chemotaxis protein
MTEDWGAILVVADDAEMRELGHDVFKDRGHQVTAAGSGQEASMTVAPKAGFEALENLRRLTRRRKLEEEARTSEVHLVLGVHLNGASPTDFHEFGTLLFPCL